MDPELIREDFQLTTTLNRIRRLSIVWRLTFWLMLLTASAMLLSRYLVSRSEIFWVLVMPMAWLGSLVFKLFPPPRMNAKSKLGRAGSVAMLLLFPLGFYGFLVFATGSPWSWTEVVTAVLFFALALETVLLYLMQGHESVTAHLVSRIGIRWKVPITIATRCVLYAGLVPFLLVILAVHRPKLLPRTLHEIPEQDRELVQFLSRDRVTRLRGVFLKPVNPKGTVLVCHGVGANHADIASILTILYDSGFQVLAFDFRGHGASDGHTITYGWAERDDVLAAYDYCLERSDVRSDRLFALGVSMGGATLLLSLPEMPLIKAAVIDSAFATLGEMTEHQFRFVPAAGRPALRQIARIMAWIEVGLDLETIRPVDSIDQTSIPLLLIHGDRDQVIPVEHARMLDAARSDNLQLHVEPDAPHIGMALLNPTEYIRLVRRQFNLDSGLPRKP